jgi:predicted TPR repeat methyltransferase
LHEDAGMKRASVDRARRKHHAAEMGRELFMALNEAMAAHQAGQLDNAETLYRRVLQMQSGQPDALHFLGMLCHQRGHSEEGIRLIRMALRAIPRHADAHNNLGNIHKENGSFADAEACYRMALACDAHQHDALGNLALTLEAQQRPEEALQACAALLELAPQLERTHYLMGTHLRTHVREIGDAERAIECFRNAIRCDNRSVRALDGLGAVLYMLGRRDEAIGLYRDWLSREPENPLARHMLAACGGAAAPPRADDDYVRLEFDRFADSFDEQLLKTLGYRAPQILSDALIGMLGAPKGALDILDAGCGTGLCGTLVRAHARRLSGVDLSTGMIEKAGLRGGYDELTVAELTVHLRTHPAAWDVVLSADTLIYFGDLTTVLSAAHGALRPGGWLAFTLEVLLDAEDRVELSSSGRYRHSRRHVERVLDSIGFDRITIASDSLRKELGEPVSGWVVLAHKMAVER